MNKIIYNVLASISFFILIILLACLTNIFNNVYAPPFGGPHLEPSPHLTEPTPHISEPTPRFSETTKIDEKIVKNTIAPAESRDTKEAKINEILHLLDMNTQAFDKKLKNEIWRDAYTFANTVIVPFIGKTMVKLLLYLAFY